MKVIKEKYQIHDSRESKKENDNMLVLSTGDSDYAFPKELSKNARKKIKIGNFAYNKGYYANTIIKDYLRQVRGFKETDKINIVHTIGAVFALQVAIEAHTKVGDTIVTINPVYPPFLEIVKLKNRKVVSVSLSSNEIDFDGLEEAFSKYNSKLLLFCNPNNPSGTIFPLSTLEKIKKIVYKYNGYIYSDEVWGDLIFGNNKFHSFAKLDTSDKSRIVSTNNLGKTFNLHALPFAYTITYNKELSDLIEETKNSIYHSNHKTPLVLGTIESCYSEKGYKWFKKYKREISRNYESMKAILEKTKIIVPPLESTHNIFLDFRNINLSHDDIFKLLVKNDVLLMDGKKFGSEGTKKMRINISVNRKKIIKACKIISSISEFNI